jgi:DNA-binding transcriptional LysR family regulator
MRAIGSFSEAARRLALTPAAVSRNVAMLERNLASDYCSAPRDD